MDASKQSAVEVAALLPDRATVTTHAEYLEAEIAKFKAFTGRMEYMADGFRPGPVESATKLAALPVREFIRGEIQQDARIAFLRKAFGITPDEIREAEKRII